MHTLFGRCSSDSRKAAGVLFTMFLMACSRSPYAEPAVLPADAAPSAQSTPAQTVPLSPIPEGQTKDGTYVPVVGQGGKDVVWVPSSVGMVEAMLDLAKVTKDDFVMDLGSGDGRNIIAAAKRGASGLGVEFNPDLVELSRRQARAEGVADRAQFVEGDMYAADVSKATVLTLFLLPSNLVRLESTFLAMKPGTRLALNSFTIDGWEPDAETRVEGDCSSWCQAYLLIVPARVAGTWKSDEGTLTLTQEYRNVSGTFSRGVGSGSVTGMVSATDVVLTSGSLTYNVRVDGNAMTGTVTDATGAKRAWKATRE